MNKIKDNMLMIIITAIICLLPMFFGIIFFDKLPDMMPTHFAVDGTPNGYSSKAFAVYGLPTIMVLIHFFCIFCMVVDPKNRGEVNNKMFKVLLFVAPIISIYVIVAVYFPILGMKINISMISFDIIALLFIVLGNYLPKTKRNYTFGYRVSWALDNDENWAKTNRLGGYVMVIGGFAIIIMSLFPIELKYIAILIGIVLAVIIFVPTVYSFLLYKKTQSGDNCNE